jgi:hypothetical protein
MIGAWILESFCVRNGQTFSNAVIKQNYLGVPKHCFANAAFFMKTAKLRYFEGFCMSDKIKYPFHHAWCMDKNNQVIEVTLQPFSDNQNFRDWDIGDYTYLGVEVSPADYKKQTTKLNTSVFDTGRGRNIKYILQRDPYIINLMSDKSKKMIKDLY